MKQNNKNKKISAISKYNTNSISFKFLENEPDLYGINDLRKKYIND